MGNKEYFNLYYQKHKEIIIMRSYKYYYDNKRKICDQRKEYRKRRNSTMLTNRIRNSISDENVLNMKDSVFPWLEFNDTFDIIIRLD